MDDDQWGFLSPWCVHLKGRLRFKDKWDAWTDTKRRLCVTLPWGDDTDIDAHEATFTKVREALALLAAVAHVNASAVVFVLSSYCEIATERPETAFQVETPLRFEIGRNPINHGNVPRDDLIRLCGPGQHENPSDEYIAALRRIAELDKRLKSGDPGVEVEIPVRVDFSSGGGGVYLDELPEIAAAEKTMKEMWSDFHSRNPEDQTVRSGELGCKFVLEPMVADISDAPIEPELVETVEQIVEGNVWFSRLELFLQFDLEVEQGRWSGRSLLGRLLRCVFGSTRRSLDVPNGHYHFRLDDGSFRQFRKLKVAYDSGDPEPSTVEALCSAIVLTQTTHDLALELDFQPDDEPGSRFWWRWLAYAFFSRRARSFSSITHLKLDFVPGLSVEDAELFTAIVLSDHPEEELFGSRRGRIEEREATLTARAPMQWMFDDAGQPLWNCRPLTAVSSIKYVRTFSDDGVSKWVDVLVPGYGRCQVKRSDLTFDCDSSALSTAASGAGITSLSIGFTSDAGLAEGLPQFMAVIGSSLTSLSLHGDRDLLGDDLCLGYCPNLLDLSIRGYVVEAQFDFREYRKSHSELSSIICNWHDVVPLCGALMDTVSPLARCLHRLRVRLAHRSAIPHGYNPANYESDLNALLEMLKMNNFLEYLEVIVPTTHLEYIRKFAQFDKKPIDRALKLPLQTKLAFLSVLGHCRSLKPAKERKLDVPVSSSALCKLDHLVLAKIFGFAVPPVLRYVACRSV